MDYSKSYKYLAAAFILGFFSTVSLVGLAAEDELYIELSFKPKQCVALHQGQNCYVNVEFNWNSNQIGDYCLHSEQQEAPLQCWENSNSGIHRQEIVMDRNVIFTVKLNESDVYFVNRELEMAWVYKKSNRSRINWRLF